MNFTLKRLEVCPDGGFGELLDESGTHFCVTLEHAYELFDQPGVLQVKIPPGVYECQRRMSPHFGYELFELKGVPGHEAIEIHKGNWQKDSHGCILLGVRRDGVMITDSSQAFTHFMEAQAGVDKFQLTVQG